MNYIHHLNAFFARVKYDNNLSTSHVSLYMALFQYWNFNRFNNPFPVYRANIMQASKVGSKNTYHKCIKELHQAGYIVFHPPLSKFLPAKITMLRFDLPKAEQQYKQLHLFKSGKEDSMCLKNGMDSVPDLTTTRPKSEPIYVPKMGHNIKLNNKQINSVYETHKIFDLNKKINDATNEIARGENYDEDCNTASPGGSVVSGDSGSIRKGFLGKLTLPELETFFQQNDYPLLEAKKFFYYNEAKGWMLNDKIQITDWKSIAHKWMIKALEDKHKNSNTNHLHTDNDKNYSEPL
jgi:hypothetical protein